MRTNHTVLLGSNKFTSFSRGKSGGMIVGGAVPVLLGQIHTMPIHGEGFSNHIVGIASPPPTTMEIAKKQPTTYTLDQQYERGAGIKSMKSAGMPHQDAVNQLKDISFHRKAARHQKRDNIKFII